MRKTKPETQAIHDWLQKNLHQFDLSITLDFHDAVRVELHAWDNIAHARLLRRYFNEIDRRVFKAAHRNRKLRVQRFVVLGHQIGVGWHAHALVSTPSVIEQEALVRLLENRWHKLTRRFAPQRNKSFDNRLFKCKPTHSDPLKYTCNHVTDFGERPADIIGEFKQGMFDADNTSLSLAAASSQP